jgi:hypothetical protein
VVLLFAYDLHTTAFYTAFQSLIITSVLRGFN